MTWTGPRRPPWRSPTRTAGHEALADLARAAAGAGDLDRAEARPARAIPDPYHRAQALADLARVAAGAGDLDRAEAAARAITYPDRQAQALADLARAAAEAGDLDRAGTLAGQAEAAARRDH